MERLTGWDKGNAYNLKCFEREYGCEDMGTSRCDYCEYHLAVYNKLAAYEDTGLTPEDISTLQEKPDRENPKLLKPTRIPGIGKCPTCREELCMDDEKLHFCPTCGTAVKPPKEENDE